MADEPVDQLNDWSGFETRSALYGANHGENERHVIVRAAFLQALLDDQKVTELFARWDEMVAPFAPIIYSPAVERDADCHRLAGVIGREAVGFVEGLDLKFPWLPVELLRLFWLRWSLDEGEEVALDISAEMDDPPAPDVVFPEFKPKEGETTGAALERFNEAAAHFKRGLLAAVAPRGTKPDADRAALERFATWFYRNKLRGESIKQIARSHFGDDDRRKDVYDGIARAEYLLGLSSHMITGRDGDDDPGR
jgi:hypothetical protein